MGWVILCGRPMFATETQRPSLSGRELASRSIFGKASNIGVPRIPQGKFVDWEAYSFKFAGRFESWKEEANIEKFHVGSKDFPTSEAVSQSHVSL